MLAQTGELAFACGLGVPYDLPVIVLPGAILPVGAACAQRDILAVPGQMLLAIEAEPFSVPNVADGIGIDIAHASIARNIVATDHHIAARIDIQAFEDEWAGHLVGVQVGGWVG